MFGWPLAKVVGGAGALVAIALSIALAVTTMQRNSARAKVADYEAREQSIIVALSNVAQIRDKAGNVAMLHRDDIVVQIGLLGAALDNCKGAVAAQNSDIALRGMILDTQRADARADAERLGKLAGMSKAQIDRLAALATSLRSDPSCQASAELMEALKGL